MKKGLIFILILVTIIFLPGFALNTASFQKSKDITGTEFLRLFRDDLDRALAYIGEIYGPKLNNGTIPHHETLYGLGEILRTYLTDHPASQGRSVEELVMEVLKNAPVQIEEQKTFWNNAYKAAEAYFLHPSPDSAEKLYTALPDKRLPYLDFEGKRRLFYFVFDLESGKNFPILEKSMEEGEPHAVDVGFRLINISDGAAGEALVYALGQIILKHPRLFLQKLLAHEGTTEPTVSELLPDILDPVGWWEIPEDDNNQVKYKELVNTRIALRIKALESVDDPGLKEMRDLCILTLKRNIL